MLHASDFGSGPETMSPASDRIATINQNPRGTLELPGPHQALALASRICLPSGRTARSCGEWHFSCKANRAGGILNWC